RLGCGSSSWLMLRSDVYFVLFIFFFSSRRRHTRLVSDWSSDVCSSDLLERQWQPVKLGDDVPAPAGAYSPAARAGGFVFVSGQRSEERRVGKEGRSGGGADCLKKRRRGEREG